MRPHVVVVGGGLAGLAAGLTCADAGARVTLLESRPRLGGATWSFERNGRWYDNGQHVFLRCCTAYRGFLRRIGTEHGTHLQHRLALPVLTPDGARSWIRRGPLPVPLHLAPAIAGYRHLSTGDRLRLGRAALALGRLDLTDPALDEMSFAAWLQTHGQRPDAIDALWDLIIRPTVNLPAQQASLALAAKVFQTGLLAEPDGADIGWATIPLAELHGVAAARALAAAGATVHLRAKVAAVEPTGVVVDGERLAADAVVVAVPHDAAAALLPPGAIANQDRLAELGTSPIVDVHLVYDAKVSDEPLAAGLHSPVQWLFDTTRTATGHDATPSEQVLAVSLSAADQWLGQRPEELIATFTRAVADLLPRARTARLLDAVVTRERAATFAGRPGTAVLRPAAATALPGLALAGAWTATGWPATMEGAVRSGLAASHHVLGGLDLARSLSPIPTDPPPWPRLAARSRSRRGPTAPTRRSHPSEVAA